NPFVFTSKSFLADECANERIHHSHRTFLQAPTDVVLEFAFVTCLRSSSLMIFGIPPRALSLKQRSSNFSN
ncbi:hypothetical protein Trydic_g10071, partial [Trypoxylus dichotomus]